MPVTSISLIDQEQSIVRPVVFSVIEELKVLMSLNDPDIVYNGISQTRSHHDQNKKDTYVETVGEDRVKITSNFSYDRDHIGTISPSPTETYPVYFDTDIDASIHPVYSKTEVRLTISYHTNSRSKTLQWMSDMVAQISQGRDLNLHTLHYSYLIPKPYMRLVDQIHDYKKTIDDVNYSQYISNTFSDRLSIKSNQIGNHTNLSINETQQRVVGRFDFSDTVPDKPNKSEHGYSMDIEYVFSFDRLINLLFKYPVMVYNQVLPDDYILIENQNEEYVDRQRFSSSMGAFNQFETQKVIEKLNTGKPVNVPDFDNFDPKQTQFRIHPSIYAMCQLEEDRRLLLNLNELGDYAIDYDILNYIKTVEYPYITEAYSSIFNVSLYIGDYLGSDTRVQCTGDLDVISTELLNPRLTYHVKIGLLTDLTLLKKEAINRIIQYPIVLCKVLKAINESIDRYPTYQKVRYGCNLNCKDIQLVIDDLIRLTTGENRGLPKTVSLGYIVALRK